MHTINYVQFLNDCIRYSNFSFITIVSCHCLMIEMFKNHAFTVFTFLHNCSLPLDQYFKPLVQLLVNQNLLCTVKKSYLLGCKLEIKTFKNNHSGRLESKNLYSSTGYAPGPPEGLTVNLRSPALVLQNCVQSLINKASRA